MPHITVQQAQAWAEQSKLALGSLDLELEDQVATQVLGRVAQAYDVSSWTDDTTTPDIVRSAIAMTYVSWFYSRQYSEDEPNTNEYAIRLLAMAEDLIAGIITGAIEVPEEPIQTDLGEAAFYPTDASSAMEPTLDDSSLGGPVFSMGTVF